MYPVLLLILWLAAAPALAQSIYKCSVNGRLVYGDRPCEGGPSTQLAVPAAPAPDPDAARALQRQKALLARMEKQRGVREAAEERAQARAARAAMVEARRCARLHLRQKWLDEDLSKTAGDNKEAVRQKARRHRQAMALECPG